MFKATVVAALCLAVSIVDASDEVSVMKWKNHSHAKTYHAPGSYAEKVLLLGNTMSENTVAGQQEIARMLGAEHLNGSVTGSRIRKYKNNQKKSKHQSKQSEKIKMQHITGSRTRKHKNNQETIKIILAQKKEILFVLTKTIFSNSKNQSNN